MFDILNGKQASDPAPAHLFSTLKNMKSDLDGPLYNGKVTKHLDPRALILSKLITRSNAAPASGQYVGASKGFMGVAPPGGFGRKVDSRFPATSSAATSSEALTTQLVHSTAAHDLHSRHPRCVVCSLQPHSPARSSTSRQSPICPNGHTYTYGSGDQEDLRAWPHLVVRQ